MSVNARDRDGRSRANDDKHTKREQYALPELRNLKDICERRNHWRKGLITNYDRSPGLFDPLTRRLTEFIGLNRQTFCQFPSGEDFQSSKPPADQTVFAQGLFIDVSAALESIQLAQVNDGVRHFETGIIEAAFRQPADEGHLTTFKTQANAATRARFLAFISFPAGLAMAGALAATQALHPMPCSRARFQIM
jgi:hypothetical protein